MNRWYGRLVNDDPDSAELVTAAIDLLESEGPTLGRPLVDRISRSSVHGMKELRPGSRGQSEFRILFVFDPERQAILLAAGDKSGNWSDWYAENVPVAEHRYSRWLAGDYNEERGS